MTAKTRLRLTSRPAKPSVPNAFWGLNPLHPTQSLGAQSAAAKAKAPPVTPSAIESALRDLPSQECPSRFTKVEPKQETWTEAFISDLRLVVSAANWTRRQLVRLGELVIYSFNVVASYLIIGVLVGMAGLAGILTAIELSAPGKAIGDG